MTPRPIARPTRLASIPTAAFAAVAVAFLASAAPAPAQRTGIAAPPETLLLQAPTVSAENVVFGYAMDLWVVPRAGGTAKRLTSSQGGEYGPRLAPDGRTIAFTADYEGNTDVYVMDVDGGAPKRLTWHPGPDRVLGWHPDGKRILFSSRRDGGPEVSRLFLVSKDGGPAEMLDIPKAERATFDADGSHVAYTPLGDAFRSWKRYRGGRTTPVWIYDLKSHEVEVVPHVNASDSYPAWLDGSVYFASDRDGVMNLFRFKPGAAAVEKLTNFTDFDVRNVSAGAGVIAFDQGGAIHIYDPATKIDTRLRVHCPSDGLDARPRWETAGGFVRAASIAPNGQRAAFEARGEIITMPREHGDARNLTGSSGVHDRDPAWSPDGRRIAWFSDASGEYQLMLQDHLGKDAPERLDLGGGGFYYDPVWSPDSKHVLFSDKTNRLAFITVATGRVTDIGQNLGALGVHRPSGVWSPDSKWIAFRMRDPDTLYDRVALFSVATATIHPVTNAFGSADQPAWSRDGKLLFFRASINSGPNRFGLDMSSAEARASESSLYVCVLAKAGKNPLAARSDEGIDTPKPKAASRPGESRPASMGAESAPTGSAAESKPAEEVPAVVVDLDGIEQRVLALPLPAGNYTSLRAAHEKLMFLVTGAGAADADDDDTPITGATLKSFDFETRKATRVATKVSAFQVSADGKHLLLQDGPKYELCGLDAKDRKTLAIAGVKLRVDPVAEWRQMLREAWRIERDYFYDQNMHGVDWNDMWKRWSAFLPHVRQRADLNLILAEMIGELCCGHEYVSGGQIPTVPAEGGVGLFGADFAAETGRWRITRIHAGQNWAPNLRAPLTEPGVDAHVGDYVISINGMNITDTDNLFAACVNTAGRQTELRLAAGPSGDNARTMIVVPLADDTELRKRSWIEGNRRRVDEMSKGRLAYIYMPDTGAGGMAGFDRDYYSQLGRDGVILDERFNHGGMVADYVVNVLARQVSCWWMNREGWLGRTPFGTMDGPKVMVVNENAGSGGDAMPWLFKQKKIGPVVGQRTWGGLVGISGYPPLMDGGSVTAASFGIMDPDGNWVVENVGVSPDVDVMEWPKDVIGGHDPQLETAVKLALGGLEKNPPKARPVYKRPTVR